MNKEIKIFEGNQIRSVWDRENEIKELSAYKDYEASCEAVLL